MALPDHCIVPDWPAPSNVKALQTTRHGGISAAPYDTLNLGLHVGDAPLAVAHNRQLLELLLPSEPVWLEQVHGTVVANADTASGGCDTLLAKPADCGSSRLVAPPAPDGSTAPRRGDTVQADACIARHRGAVCVVMTADCLPVLLCDEAGTVVGVAHAGWKGLVAGVIEATVIAMNVQPQKLMAWLGPAIGQDAFEVGAEVRAAFIAHQAEAAEAFIAHGDQGKYKADLYLLARQRLHALGIKRIHGGTFCTFHQKDKFFSYRRDSVTGRMGTFIWLG